MLSYSIFKFFIFFFKQTKIFLKNKNSKVNLSLHYNFTLFSIEDAISLLLINKNVFNDFEKQHDSNRNDIFDNF
jgi:hypothetical protein